MQNYAWMAIACWLTIQGLSAKHVLPQAVPWLWWGVAIFGALSVVLGFIPTVQQAIGAVGKLRIGK